MKNTIYILGAIAATYCSLYLISQMQLVSGILLIIPVTMFCAGVKLNRL